MFDPWDDIRCQEAFIEANYQDFEDYCRENNLAFGIDYEFIYCEANEKHFLEFAAKFEQDQIDDKADKDNDALKERE